MALVALTSFIFLEGKNLSGFEILVSNFPYFPILLSICLIITFYLVYQKKIAIEEIEGKLKKYREKRGIEYETRGSWESKGAELQLPFDPAGLYYPTKRKVVVYSSFLPPLPGYETRGVKVMKEKYPEYWKEIEELLLKAIKEPYSRKETPKGISKLLKKMKIFKNEEDELYSKFNKLKRKIIGKLEYERKKYRSLMSLRYIIDDLLDYLVSIRPEFIDIVHPYVLLPPEEAKKKISVLLQEMHHLPLYYLPDKFKKLPLTIEKAVHASLYSSQVEEYFYDLYMMKKELEEEIEKVSSFQQIDKELEEIAQFLVASHQTKLGKISEHIFREAHETGHGIFHTSFLKEEETRAFYSTGLFGFFDEGFADAFTLYYIAKQVEKGYLPLDVLKLVARRERGLLEHVLKLLESGKEVGIYLNYVVGDKIFYLDKAWEEIERLSPEELSPEELRRKVREIRKMIGSRIEYVSGIIKSHIPFEEKHKKLKEIKEEAHEDIFGF
jgi:hypothetical protein